MALSVLFFSFRESHKGTYLYYFGNQLKNFIPGVGQLGLQLFRPLTRSFPSETIEAPRNSILAAQEVYLQHNKEKKETYAD